VPVSLVSHFVARHLSFVARVFKLYVEAKIRYTRHYDRTANYS